MTEIEQYRGGQVTGWSTAAPRPQQNTSVVALTEWAAAARAAHEVSEILVRTPFVPKAYAGSPYAATAAILAGGEVGFNPMAALNAFDVIEGRAAAKAMTLRAIVQAAGHELWTQESTDARAIVCGRRAGSDHIETATWTIQRAKSMNLTGKKNWREQPTAMLLARATSECARLVAADAILGLAYSSEELADGGQEPEVPAAIEAAPAPARRTAQRASRGRKTAAGPDTPPAAPGPSTADTGGQGAAVPAGAAGPPLPGEDGYDDRPTDDAPLDPDGPTTPAMNKKMHALFREAACTERDDRLYLTGLLLDRKLDTSKGLTVQDGKAVIDALENLKAAGHPEGLVGAVNDLINAAEQRRIEAEASEQDAEDRSAADDAAAES